MINVPQPIYGITGGNDVMRAGEYGDSYVSSLCDVVCDVSGMKREDLHKLGFIEVQVRGLESAHRPGCWSDDSITMFNIRGRSIAQMISVRDEWNNVYVSYSNISEEEIVDLAKTLVR